MRAPAIAPFEETGSLGILHLKRFWSQTLAATAARPPESESDPSRDHTLLCGIHAGVHEAIAFIQRNSPTFEQFESWVLEINGGSLDPARVAHLNAALAGLTPPGHPPAPGSPEAPFSAEDLAHWREHGYVILHDAISPAQCHLTAQAIYHFLAVDPAKPDTWYSNPAGHSIWVPLLRHPAFLANRQAPRIHAAFSQLWGRTDLWPTVDQGGFNPPERPGWPFPGPHLHWDTSIATPVPLGIQGILYLTDTAADQGAFQCVPGFHHRLESWLAQLPEGVNPRDHALMKTLPAIPIPGRAGDLVIWHHALPHGASPNRSARPRVAQYLTLRPGRTVIQPVWR